jgi:hypothetical protein
MLKKQTILSHVLPNEQEAMVRIFLKDPLPILSAIQSVETEINQEEEQQEKEEEKNKNKNNNRDLKVIGPLGLSRKDSLEVIEQKIKVSRKIC